jgi:hypothetical protein
MAEFVSSGRLNYQKHGCDIEGILTTMIAEQREHSYATFGETYLKVSVRLTVGSAQQWSCNPNRIFLLAAVGVAQHQQLLGPYPYTPRRQAI